MSMETTIPYRTVNKDRMAAFSAFRAAMPSHAADVSPAQGEAMGGTASTSAATVLPTTPAPRTTRLDDAQADGILSAMQQENKDELLQAHTGLDADRVARLLSLLD